MLILLSRNLVWDVQYSERGCECGLDNEGKGDLGVGRTVQGKGIGVVCYQRNRLVFSIYFDAMSKIMASSFSFFVPFTSISIIFLTLTLFRFLVRFWVSGRKSAKEANMAVLCAA